MLISVGTTDCLGHVALLTCLFADLARKQPQIPIPVYGVLISDEEVRRNGYGCEMESIDVNQLQFLSPSIGNNMFRLLTIRFMPQQVGVGNVGVEEMSRKGDLEFLKGGPLIWLDCADCQPNIGSGGVVQWSLTATGKLAHSGRLSSNSFYFASCMSLPVQNTSV